MNKAYRYDSNGYYIDSMEMYNDLLPHNSTNIAPAQLDENDVPPLKQWYQFDINYNSWQAIEDHRKRRDTQGQEIPDSGTAYWLPGDTYQTPARYMDTPGPLPAGALLSQPEMTQAEKDAQRKQEIMSRLSAIDSESIRPLRAIADGTATEYDRQKLQQLDAEAAGLRTELETLGV